MALSRGLREEIRNCVDDILAERQHQIDYYAGSYNYLCRVAGAPTFCHQPVGPVLAVIPHIL